MQITDIRYYNGARKKLTRLGMSELFLELFDMLISTRVPLLEEKNANGAAVLRKLIDAAFNEGIGWEKQVSGGIDWKKRIKFNETIAVTIGVEIQVSARSDLLVRDIIHLRNSIQEGEIEVGLIVVPSNRLQIYLPDRTPSIGDAIRYIEQEFKEAMTYPIVVIAVEHDGPGPALSKQVRDR